MKSRIRINIADPEAYKAMMALEKYLSQSRLTPIQKELIKVRASQINGCAYCVDMHIKEALEAGESPRRLAVLSVWRDTPFFTEEEQAILALTEEITLIANHVSDETYERAAKLFDEQYLAQIIMAINTINAWNRIGISTEMQPA